MIVRTAVAVALAIALVGVSLPVVERARVDHSEATIAGELERVERSAVALAAGNDVVGDGGPPARTHVTLSLPVRSWGHSGVGRLRIPNGTAGPDVTWQAAGGVVHNRTYADVAFSGPPGGLAVGDGGRQRLALTLEPRGGERTVIARRPQAGPSSGG